MTLNEFLRRRILKFLKLDHLNDNPNSDRYTYLSDKDNLILRKVEECKVWYYGDSDELLNFYTSQQTYGNAKNPIYNRNKQQYFWGQSAEECGIKRIHSGVPNAIISTIVNVIGESKISSEVEQERVDKIIEKTRWRNIVNQQQMPLTLALGWGAFKPIIDDEVCADSPLIEWYDASDTEFVVKHGVVCGVIFKDYFKKDDKDYVLVETRRVKGGDSYIEYNLLKLGKNNDVQEVELTELPNTADLNKEGLVLKGYNKVLAVPSVYFFDLYNKGYGRSIIANKVDLFDDLDQDLSQASQTSRVSTPVEYIPVDLLGRGRNGQPQLPKIYNRQFLESTAYPDGDGEIHSDIRTTQPQLNFNQYTDKCRADLDYILTGILSPATMGIEIAKKDNAEAQREKEKVTIMTRNNIIDRQKKIEKELMELMLDLDTYMHEGKIPLETNYNIAVEFSEFANPSQENIMETLSPMLRDGAISPELFVEKVYGDTMTGEDKAKEVEYIKSKQQAESLDMGDFDINATGTTTTPSGANSEEEATAEVEKSILA